MAALMRIFPGALFLPNTDSEDVGRGNDRDFTGGLEQGRMGRIHPELSSAPSQRHQQFHAREISQYAESDPFSAVRTHQSPNSAHIRPTLHTGSMASWVSEPSSTHALTDERPEPERKFYMLTIEQEDQHRRADIPTRLTEAEALKTVSSLQGLDGRTSASTAGMNPVPRKSSGHNHGGDRSEEYLHPLMRKSQTPTGYKISANTYTTDGDDFIRYTYSQTGFALVPAPAPPHNASNDQKVLFINSIQYDNPRLVLEIEKAHKNARSIELFIPGTPRIPTRSLPIGAPEFNDEPSESPVLPSHNNTPILSQRPPSKKHTGSPKPRKSPRRAPPPTKPLPVLPGKKQVPPPIMILQAPLAPPYSAVGKNTTASTPATPFETASAWMARVAPTTKQSMGPVLVDVYMSRKGSLRDADTANESQKITNLSTSEGEEREPVSSLTTAGSSLSSSLEHESESLTKLPSLYQYDSRSLPSTYSMMVSEFGDNDLDPEDRHKPYRQLSNRSFKLGDDIPTFYSSREGNSGYGGRRKKPPTPLGMVPMRHGDSHKPLPPVLPNKVPTKEGKHRPKPLLAPTHGLALLHQLEMEISEQESQWKGMSHTLTLRDSLESIESPKPDPHLKTPLAVSNATDDLEKYFQTSLVNLDEKTESGAKDYVDFDLAVPLLPTVYVDPQQAVSPLMLTGESGEWMCEKEEQWMEEDDDPARPPEAAPVTPPQRLWQAPSPVSPKQRPPTPHLWTSTPHHLWTSTSPHLQNTDPAAAVLKTRPNKRHDPAPPPPVRANSRLWTKRIRTPPHPENKGLWKDPKAPFQPRGIMGTTTRRPGHRVAFVEEVVIGKNPPPRLWLVVCGIDWDLRRIVERSGHVGERQKLWGGVDMLAAVVAVEDGGAVLENKHPSAGRYKTKALPKLPATCVD